MGKRIRRTAINKINSIEPVVQNRETGELTMITPDKNPTEMPYQGYMSNQEYYHRMQSSCFDLDSALKEIIEKKFTGNNLRNMSDEDAIAAYSAMETAKANRTKQFIDLATHMADNDFFKKMAEIERLRTYGSNKIIDYQTVQENPTETDGVENKETIKEIDREKEQHVIKLLQLAVMKKLEEHKSEQDSN